MRIGCVVPTAVVNTAGAGPAAPLSRRRMSTAWRKLTFSYAMMNAITSPPLLHSPKQCHRFFAGVITKDGSRSSWKGQHPTRFSPWPFNAIPRRRHTSASATSRFNRSKLVIGDSGHVRLRAQKACNYRGILNVPRKNP